MEENKDTTLQEILRLTQENNEMLHHLKRREEIGTIFKVIYWGLIIASAYGAYYYVQPYINLIMNNLQILSASADSLQSVLKQTENLQDTQNLKGILETLLKQ